MRQLLVTRFMYYATMVLLFLMVGVGLIVWIEAKRPEKDNATLYVIIFGFVTTNIGVLLAKAAGDKNQDVLQNQNVVLDQVHEKVNGGTTRLIAAIKAEHDAAIATLREELQRERHTLKGQNGVLTAALNHVEGELVALRETKAHLEAQAANLAEKLSRCAEANVGQTGPRGEKGDKGEPGDPNC